MWSSKNLVPVWYQGVVIFTFQLDIAPFLCLALVFAVSLITIKPLAVPPMPTEYSSWYLSNCFLENVLSRTITIFAHCKDKKSYKNNCAPMFYQRQCHVDRVMNTLLPLHCLFKKCFFPFACTFSVTGTCLFHCWWILHLPYLTLI